MICPRDVLDHIPEMKAQSPILDCVNDLYVAERIMGWLIDVVCHGGTLQCSGYNRRIVFRFTVAGDDVQFAATVQGGL